MAPGKVSLSTNDINKCTSNLIHQSLKYTASGFIFCLMPLFILRCILFDMFRVKSIKKELKKSKEKMQERLKKKEEKILKSSSKPKRLGRQKYPKNIVLLRTHYVCSTNCIIIYEKIFFDKYQKI